MLRPLRQGSHEVCSVKHMGIATAVQWIPGHLVQPTCVTCGISLAFQAILEYVDDDSKRLRGGHLARCAVFYEMQSVTRANTSLKGGSQWREFVR